MSEKHEISTLTNNEMTYLKDEDAAVTALNRKIVKFRKTGLVKLLMDSTKSRIHIVRRIRVMLDLIESRLFDPAVIKELDINKCMSLMKIVMMFSVKMFSQIDKMEGVLRSYLQAEQMVNQLQTGVHTPDEEAELKKKLTKTFVDIFTKSAETIDPTKNVKPISTGNETIITTEMPAVPPKAEVDKEGSVCAPVDVEEDIEKESMDMIKSIDSLLKGDILSEK